MTVGFVMLVHAPLRRAEQVARHWASHGCPIVIHVDKRVDAHTFRNFQEALSEFPNVLFSDRHKCEWGTWSLVAASQTASELLLEAFPEVRHVFLASGACLPLRPVQELIDYLDARPLTNFIESATTKDVPWTKGGLDNERFLLRFPFSWKRQRFLFDRYVKLQRRLGVTRKLPEGITPHLGSQWWCLTRQTLSAILEDPNRDTYERYFRKVWIPDESYYQTLVRLHSANIESRSLTLSKFDFQGKPHIFYDDHLQLLRRSDCFVARKIWPKADRIYRSFLQTPSTDQDRAEPSPGKIDRVFSKAVDKRTRGRPGLYMQSRFPNLDWENGRSCGPYTVLQGFGDLFQDFVPWLEQNTQTRAHGHLFGPEGAEFAQDQRLFAGGLSSSATLRDYNPQAFLTNLLWNTRGERQSFLYGPRDTQDIMPFLISDANASISIITGAWAVPLYHANLNFTEIRETAARLQKIEDKQIKLIQTPRTKARVHIWTLADFVETPLEPLQSILTELKPRASGALTEAPRLVSLDGFGQFLQTLKNQGMHPHLMGDYPSDTIGAEGHRARSRPYLVR